MERFIKNTIVYKGSLSNTKEKRMLLYSLFKIIKYLSNNYLIKFLYPKYMYKH